MLESTAFTFVPGANDWLRILPEMILLGTALVVLLADLFAVPGRKGWLAPLGLVGVVAAAVTACALFANNETGTAFYGMMSGGRGAMFADVLVLFSVGVGLVCSPGFIERQGITHEGEYYALMLISALGMMLMASAMNLMMIFVGLEVLSLALYVLCAIVPGRFRSQESGMKYFILSSFASAFLLYGMALTYGATGATALTGIHTFLATHTAVFTSGFGPLVLIGLGLMVVGFCFKVSSIPFQAWTPDVYVGAPTTVTAFMSVGTKVAAFVALIRVFFFALPTLVNQWEPVFWAIAVLTMIFGNLFAVTQRDVKRMLAYSSIANAGYMLIAVAVGTSLAVTSLLIYLACYTAMNVGAFGVVLAVERNDGRGTALEDFAGLSRRQPWLAAIMALFLFALAGIPATTGFIGKWYVFYAAIVGGHLELAIIGAVTSMIGVFYYLRVVWAMYFTAPQVEPETPSVTGEPAVSLPSSRPVAALAAVGAAGGTGETTEAFVVTEVAPAAVPEATSATTVKTPATATPVKQAVPVGVWVGLAVSAVVTLGMGIVPGGMINLAVQAASALLR